jgi:replicative DNA helicase
MVETTSATEGSVADMIAASYMGGSPTEDESEQEEVKAEKFEFSDAFQSRIAALTLRDDGFVRKTIHLLNPDHFENVGEAALVSMAIKHFKKYNAVPATASMKELITEAIRSGVIRKDILSVVSAAWKQMKQDDLTDGNYVADKLAEFARHQATAQAILASVSLLEKKNFSKIESSFKAALEIGLNEDGGIRSYWDTEARTEERADRIAGKMPPMGITTGIHRMDELLYHKGWGRKELTIIMGGAKAGKTTALINFAQAASLAGKNVLYVTCEVAARIIEERLDACITNTLMKDLTISMKTIESKLSALEARAGKLDLAEYPSGMLSPAMLRKLLEAHKSKGTRYDMVVVDYADIMCPDNRTDSVIENSKSIGLGLRAIAFEFDCAVLTATQTNREGFKATVAKAEHVAEDFNKIRTADLVISINKTEEEAKKGEARLYFAASRNQESGFVIIIKQDLARMKFVESVIGVE